MKGFWKFLRYLFTFLLLLVVGLWVSGNGYMVKAIALTMGRGKMSVSIDDYRFFDNRLILTKQHQPWQEANTYNAKDIPLSLQEAHDKYESIAWLVVKNDQIIQEAYWDIGGKESVSNSFSMAKTIVSLCMFKAIEEGYIKSMDQAVGDFLEPFKEGDNALLTVGDLSRMSSGLSWDESYSSPWSVTTKAYFDKNLDELVLDLDVVETPGQSFKYLSGNTALLALVVQEATGMTLSDYCSQKFWQPMGASKDAMWMLDQKNGVEKAYCCFNSNARDFARWGKMSLHLGNWDGKQLLDSMYIEKAIRPAFDASPEYGYSFWLDDSFGTHVYFMRGILGQYIICIPEHDLVIVRLGHKRGKKTYGRPHPDDYYIWVREALQMYGTGKA